MNMWDICWRHDFVTIDYFAWRSASHAAKITVFACIAPLTSAGLSPFPRNESTLINQ